MISNRPPCKYFFVNHIPQFYSSWHNAAAHILREQRVRLIPFFGSNTSLCIMLMMFIQNLRERALRFVPPPHAHAQVG